MRVQAGLHRLEVLQNLEALTMDKVQLYGVTAINRMTRKREIISGAADFEATERKRKNLLKTRQEKRPYIYPQTVKYPKQLNLFTNQLDV